MSVNSYDALLVLSFGGPERMEDVIPFLERVLEGKRVPRERLLEVAHHYELFDGVSPLNDQNRALISALQTELNAHGLALPVYWGNRNWHPLLEDTLRQMQADGVQRALAFFTSAYSSYSGCRQYREDIGEAAPQIDRLRMFYNHPGFIEANVDHCRAAFEQIPPERRAAARLVFTAHSIPMAMAANSAYVTQLHETCRLVADRVGRADWQLVYQSRSGSPHQPWLAPDIADHLRDLRASGAADVVVMPIGFISDHMEVLYDLDTEAQALADEIGLHMVRAATAGTHPLFIGMIRELIEERLNPQQERRFLGAMGAHHDICPADCCLPD